jgi:cobalt/nickel transport system permease protein
MTHIDQYAYFSFLRDVHPGEKFIFALLTMALVLILNSIVISVFVAIIMALMIIIAARVNYKTFFRLMLLPMGFLIIGCAAVAVSITITPLNFLLSFKIGSLWIGVTNETLSSSINLFFRANAAVTCMYFLALTTPMTQIIYVLRKLMVPEIIIDLMVLIYNNIFVFFKTANNIYISQVSRCGYNGFMGKLKSLSYLCSNLFIKCIKNTDETYNALLSRGFNGQLRVIEEKYQPKKRNLAGILAFDAVIVLTYFIGRF